MNKLCFVCETEIIGNYRMFPLERPYVNLIAHPDCFLEIDMAYLQDNYDKILKYTGKAKQFAKNNEQEKKPKKPRGAPKLLDHEENI